MLHEMDDSHMYVGKSEDNKCNQVYTIKEATYSFKLSYAMNNNLWNAFEHSLTVQINDDSQMDAINEEVWDKVITQVENKIEESQKLYQ